MLLHSFQGCVRMFQVYGIAHQQTLSAQGTTAVGRLLGRILFYFLGTKVQMPLKEKQKLSDRSWFQNVVVVFYPLSPPSKTCKGLTFRFPRQDWKIHHVIENFDWIETLGDPRISFVFFHSVSMFE